MRAGSAEREPDPDQAGNRMLPVRKNSDPIFRRIRKAMEAANKYMLQPRDGGRTGMRGPEQTTIAPLRLKGGRTGMRGPENERLETSGIRRKEQGQRRREVP